MRHLAHANLLALLFSGTFSVVYQAVDKKTGDQGTRATHSAHLRACTRTLSPLRASCGTLFFCTPPFTVSPAYVLLCSLFASALPRISPPNSVSPLYSGSEGNPKEKPRRKATAAHVPRNRYYKKYPPPKHREPVGRF